MDLEQLLTGSGGFGLTTASFLQRARCRIADGAPLGDLLERGTDFDRKCLETAIGCSPALLPVGAPPTEFYNLAPIRTAKSLEMAALGTARTQTIDVEIHKPGEEPPRIALIATEIDNATVLRGHLNVINERPLLRALKVGETNESVFLRHPSGLVIELTVIAAKRGGYSLASRWLGSVLFDEAPGWYGSSHIVNLEESRDQALGRLLPGAQLYYGGSKWQPAGHCFEQHREHFGKPTPEIVVFSPQEVDGISPARQLNPVYWTEHREQRVAKASRRTFSMLNLNLFGSAQNAALDYDDAIAAFAPLTAAYVSSGEWFGFADFSDLSGPDGDETVLIVAGWLAPDKTPRYKMCRHPNGAECEERDELGYPIQLRVATRHVLRVQSVHSWRGRHPMGDVVAEMSGILKRYGATMVATDQRSDTAVQALFSQHAIRAVSYHWSNESKHDAVQALARALAARELSICESPKLREQMLAYGYRLAPGGRFVYQGRGANDDHVAALLTGMMFLESPEALMLSERKARAIHSSPHRAHMGGRTQVGGR